MPEGATLDERQIRHRRGRLSALLFVTGALTGVFLTIVVLVFVVLPARQASRMAGSSAAPSVPTPPPAASGQTANPLQALTPDELRALTRELLSYQTFIDNLKIFLPILGGILVTIFGTLGFYLVRANYFEAQIAMTKEVQGRLADMNDELREWKRDAKADADQVKAKFDRDIADFQDKAKAQQETALTELERKAADATAAATEAKEAARTAKEESRKLAVEQEIQTAIQFENVDYALALGFWRMRDFDSAVVYARRAQERTQLILGRLDRANALYEKVAEHVWFATGDLAYYCAGYFEATGRQDLAAEALRHARALWAYLEALAPPQRIAGGRIALVDNYVFAVSRARPLTIQDKEAWKSVFETWGRYIRDHLRDAFPDEQGTALYTSYETFAASLD